MIRSGSFVRSLQMNSPFVHGYAHRLMTVPGIGPLTAKPNSDAEFKGV